MVIVKMAVNAVSAYGINKVVGEIVKNNTPETIGKFGKIAVSFGGLVVTGLIEKSVNGFIEDSIDDIKEVIKEFTEDKTQTEEA